MEKFETKTKKKIIKKYTRKIEKGGVGEENCFKGSTKSLIKD